MELNKIKEAAERFGTPLYLFDLDCIRDRVQRFRDAFEGEIGLTYSMKTNPFLTLEMSRQVERIEVCSMGEFRICRDLGIAPEKLYISGVLKIREDLMEILAYGGDSARYTAESPLQLQMLSDWADAHDKTLRVYPRLTNKSQFKGAAVLFYPDLQRRISELLQGGYYVLPISVHEVLIVPDSAGL